MGDESAQAADDRVTFTLRRTHLYAGIGLVLGFVGGFAVARAGSGVGTDGALPYPGPVAQAPPAPVAPERVTIDVAGRPARGPADAPVTIVEFTDYQCPFCRQHFEVTLEPLLQRYEGRVRYVVMNFPIPQLHPDAIGAAQAAECAADQDRFWEYHDRLFRAEAHDRASLKQYARALGLRGAEFDACLDSGAHAALVREHVQVGTDAGVAGTPAFFINGRRIDGAMPLDVFALTIDEELAASQED